METPGVALEFFDSPVSATFRTGVAGFIGAAATAAAAPLDLRLTSWPQFAHAVPPGAADALLYDAVQGFFGNGGGECQVVVYQAAAEADPLSALDGALATLALSADVDLVCAPSLMGATNRGDLQRRLVATCAALRDDWFLILDPLPVEDGVSLEDQLTSLRAAWSTSVAGQSDNESLARPFDAALYVPWVSLGGPDFRPMTGSPPTVPASGYVAGIYSRLDRETGPHRSPANESLKGIVDLAAAPASVPAEVNELRPLPGRGVCVWGARTLAASGPPPSPHVYVGVRRLVLTLRRWLRDLLDWTVFEPNTFRLWLRVRRELTAHLTKLYLQGALQGQTPEQAFRVKCDEENNPDSLRSAGKLCVDLDIAPAVPKEFITIRLVRSPDGVAAT
jgi:hypothetical protein